MNCLDCFKNKQALVFVGGIATAIIGKKILKSQVVRDFCVENVARGMMIYDDAKVSLNNIKEGAEDIIYDAKNLKEYVCDCADGCDCCGDHDDDLEEFLED